MPASDTAVPTAIEADILRPEVITTTLRKAIAKLRPSAEAAQARRTDLQKRLPGVTREPDRLTTAIVTTGPVPSVLDAVKDRERQRENLTGELAALDQAGKRIDWTKTEHELQTKLKDWKGLLQRQVPQARQILKSCSPDPFSSTRCAKPVNAATRSAHRSIWGVCWRET